MRPQRTYQNPDNAQAHMGHYPTAQTSDQGNSSQDGSQHSADETRRDYPFLKDEDPSRRPCPERAADIGKVRKPSKLWRMGIPKESPSSAQDMERYQAEQHEDSDQASFFEGLRVDATPILEVSEGYQRNREYEPDTGAQEEHSDVA